MRRSAVIAALSIATLLAIGLAVLSARRRVAESLDRLLEQAQADARAGRYEQAEETLERLAVGREPSAAERLIRASVAAGRNRLDRAVAELSRIPNHDPIAPVARLSQGQLEARRGRLRFAEVSFLDTLKLAPKSAQARRELVYIYTVQQRLHEMDAQLVALSDQNELDLQHLLHWGMIRHAQWSAAADVAPLERYVAADPDDRRSRIALTDAYVQLGRFAEADALLAKLDESDSDVLLRRVRLAIARGDLDLADAVLDRAPADLAGLAKLRGARALARNDGSAALRYFKIAQSQEPHDRAALFGLATSLTLSGDREAAKPFEEEVRRLDELGGLITRAEASRGAVDPALARRIGVLCANVARTGEARAWLKFAISKDPLDSEAQQALYSLDRQSVH